jgi:hypothetical protein
MLCDEEYLEDLRLAHWIFLFLHHYETRSPGEQFQVWLTKIGQDPDNESFQKMWDWISYSVFEDFLVDLNIAF